ncbi:SMI1/KNR4 family protein [Kitasatospora mediocidica]|uniref:SMI1/KNR4 family protein n=1 Tax=Kitasatospora mediocidica TaxID=58352 RepID=UPI000AB6B4C0|nr:SMI1/KNR4 family protein [Kitasatospora mediocidica]
MTHLSHVPPRSCEAAWLLPDGPPYYTLEFTSAACSAAHAALADDDAQREPVGRALIHLLDHGFTIRPDVARTIVELVPEQRAAAAAQLRLYRADRTNDRARIPYPHQDVCDTSSAALLTQIALAVLDPGELQAAREQFGITGGADAAVHAAAFARLGAQPRADALARLTACAELNETHGGPAVPQSMLLMALEPSPQADAARSALVSLLLFPDAWKSPEGPLRELPDFIPAGCAAAREMLAEDAAQREPVGSALGHLLDLGFVNRTEVARTIVDLVPEQRAFGAAKLSGYLADLPSDRALVHTPRIDLSPAGPAALGTQIALATLDPGEAAAARARFRLGNGSADGRLAADFALLGPRHTDDVLVRMAARLTPQGVRAMFTLSPYVDRQRVYELLHEAVAGGVAVGLLATPLTALDPAERPDAVRLALGSLLLSPEEYLVTGGDKDVVAAVLDAGPEYQDQVTEALWQVVRNLPLNRTLRLQAAARLGAPDREAAERFLTGPDCESARLERAAVADVWRRIEGSLMVHAPALLGGLAGPASAEEIAAAETQLGYRLPADFAASCMIHRAVAVPGAGPDEWMHWDVRELAAIREETADDWSSQAYVPLTHEGDGSHLVLDLDPDGSPGRLIYSDQGWDPDPGDVRAPSWLSALESFADHLEAGRYRYRIYDEATGAGEILYQDL